jgi:signal transduction histidine kinase
MRERLTVAFVVLTIVLLLGAGVVRSFVLRDLIQEQEADHLRQEIQLVSTIVEDREAAGGAIDERFLTTLVGPERRLEYAPRGGQRIVVHGPDYTGTDEAGDDLSATLQLDEGRLMLSQSPDVIGDILGRDTGSIAALFLLIAVVAGVVGFLISSALSSPFQRLAVAAAALGRGRFDLELPRSRIPEARAIANALRASAKQLEDRVQRERDFAEHASHVLRTPLTGMRLELEDLTLRDDVPPDVQASARRSLAAVEEVGADRKSVV